MQSSAVALRNALIPFCLTLALAGCGKSGTEATNSIAMKNLEVVDGTTTDSMTDLDGVRAEGTAMAPVAANSAAPSPAASSTRTASNSATPAETDAEVVSEQ
jgi:hypothetical protein